MSAIRRLGDIPFVRPDGSEGLLGLVVSPMKNAIQEVIGLLILGADTTERRLLERQLVQAQKLESIGQLAAGIAHEINTPTQYVGNSSPPTQGEAGFGRPVAGRQGFHEPVRCRHPDR